MTTSTTTVKTVITSELAERINTAHQRATQAAQTAVEAACECGQALLEAKSELPHGEFQNWVSENCTFSIRTARRYMKIAQSLPELKTDTLSVLTMADILRGDTTESLIEDIDELLESFRRGDIEKITDVSIHQRIDEKASRVRKLPVGVLQRGRQSPEAASRPAMAQADSEERGAAGYPPEEPAPHCRDWDARAEVVTQDRGRHAGPFQYPDDRELLRAVHRRHSLRRGCRLE